MLLHALAPILPGLGMAHWLSPAVVAAAVVCLCVFRMRPSTAWTRLICLPLALCSLAAPAAAATGPSLEPVTLQLKWTHAFQFAGYYAALEKGYYREAGLDVTILEATPGVDPIKNVIDGRAQFGVGTSSLLLERKAGKPVVALAVIFQHSPYVLIARHESATQGIHDLIGKRIMLEPQSDEILAYLKAEGIPLDRITRVEHSYDPQDLIDGRVDAIAGYVTNQPYDLDLAHVPYQIYTPRSAGIDFYGDNLFTTEQELQDHPARTKAFRAASLRGWQYAMAHPEEIVDLILARYSQRHSRDYYLFEARQMVPLLRPELIESGYMYAGRWRHIADVYAELGMMEPGFDLKGFLYDPNPSPPDLRWWYTGIGLALAVGLVASLIALRFLRLSTKLKRTLEDQRQAETALRAAKEAAEAATQVKEQFLARLSHELRTPLTPVLLLTSQWQTQPDLPMMLREDLATVCRNLELEARLLDDLLDVNRILYGKLSLRREAVPLHQAIRQALKTVAPAIQVKQLKLDVDLRATHDRVEGDAARIQQILWNLLNNATKFSGQGGSITVSTTDEPGGQIRVEVADGGIGIEPGALSRLFTPFEQADQQINREYGGLGLGLSICKSMVEAHGGSIAAMSRGAGQGATFTIRFPLAHSPTLAQPSGLSSIPPTPAAAVPVRILLVEDHPDTARLTSRLLRAHGYAVQTAGDVGSGLIAARRGDFDLLISDLGLPDGSGMDLLRQLAAVGRPIKAIAVSGYGTEEDVRKSREAGFAQHLVKPIDLPQLIAAIERLVGPQAAIEQAESPAATSATSA